MEYSNNLLHRRVLQQSFEVLAFLAYWEKFQNIRQDEKLIIQINHHLHGMMWNSKNGTEKGTFRRHKIFEQDILMMGH